MLATVERFGATTITLYNGADELPAGPGYAMQADLPAGGARDLFGSGWGRIGARTIRKSGELIADDRATLEAAADALRGLSQQRGALYVRMDSGAVRWCNARCIRVAAPRSVENTLFLPVTLEWVQLDPYWRGERHGGGWVLDADTYGSPPGTIYLDQGRYFDEDTGDVITLVNVIGATGGAITNDGNTPVYDPLIIITAGGDPITYVKVSGPYCEWEWSGTLAAGHALAFDAGALQIYQYDPAAATITTDEYANLSFTSNHKIADWFQLLPGINAIEVTATGTDATATATFKFDNGFM